MTKLRKQYVSRLKKLMRKQKGASRIHTGDMWEVIGAMAEMFHDRPNANTQFLYELGLQRRLKKLEAKKRGRK